MLSKFSQSLVCLASLLTAVPTLAASCADLERLAIDSVSIGETEHREAGKLGQNRAADLLLPAHCRVAAVLSPSDDSHIEMELWLPDNWNGKFLALGNGG